MSIPSDLRASILPKFPAIELCISTQGAAVHQDMCRAMIECQVHDRTDVVKGSTLYADIPCRSSLLVTELYQTILLFLALFLTHKISAQRLHWLCTSASELCLRLTRELTMIPRSLARLRPCLSSLREISRSNSGGQLLDIRAAAHTPHQARSLAPVGVLQVHSAQA